MLTAERIKEKEKEMTGLCESLIKTIEEKEIRHGSFRREDVNSESNYKFMVTPFYYAKALAGL